MAEFNWSNYQGHDRDWFDKTLGEIHEDTQADAGKTYQETLQDMYGWTPGESSSGKPSSYNQPDYQPNVIARPTQASTPTVKTEQAVAKQPIDIPSNLVAQKSMADTSDKYDLPSAILSDVFGQFLAPSSDMNAKSSDELFGQSLEKANEDIIGPSLEPRFEFDESKSDDINYIRKAFAQEQEGRKSPQDMNLLERFNEEAKRRMTDNEGNLVNPLDWNLLGFTSQRTSSPATKALYDYYFKQEDDNLRNGDPLARIADAQQRRRAVDNAGEVLDPYAIDDGVDPRSRESLFMTGEQYIKYRDEFGIPGRDVEDIDPNEIYSKQDEQDQYGFTPYITNAESLQKFHDDAAPHALSNVFNRLANARRKNTDFNVNFNGQNISGHDLIRQGNLWWQRNAGKINDAEVITDPSKVTEDSVPYAYTLKDSNGDLIVAKSALVNSYIDEQNRPVMQFEDGDIWTFDDMDDYRDSLGEQPVADGEYTSYWKNIEPLILDDGTKLRADQAEELLKNSNYQNYADYGDFNFSQPFIDDPFKDKQGNFNLNPAENSFLPWITDVALGSVPFFFKPTAAAQGIGNATASYTGFQPGYQDFLNGTYSLLSDNPTREEQVSATLGSLALPVTEHLWGNIGGSMVGKPLMRAIGKNEADIAPLLRYGMGTVGEGLEEIPGNVVEEFQGGSGLSGWYADDMYRDADGNLTTDPALDENGNPTNRVAYDNQGNVIKNTDTDLVGRLHNFGEDIPLSFIGGMTLGSTLGAPAIRSYYNEYTPRKREREEFGNNLERPDFDSNLVVDLTDEERDFYNR